MAATWVADYLKGELNYRDMDIRDAFAPEKMVYILDQLNKGIITDKGAVEVIRDTAGRGRQPERYYTHEESC